MEISRHLTPALSVHTEATGKAVGEQARPARESAPERGAEPRLEALQNAMRSLPEVDLDKVAAIKAALQRGEISTDAGALATSMLAYHNGSVG